MRITEAKHVINNSKRIFIFTGAGVSKESGIPTFRDDNGIWEEYNPLLWCTKTGLLINFTFNIKKFSDFFVTIIDPIVEAQPNLAHYAINDLQVNKTTLILTQNIDNLHQEAGNTGVHEIHGNIFEITKNNIINKLAKSQFVDHLKNIRHAKTSKELRSAFSPILSFKENVRPNIVLFNEPINTTAYNKAETFIKDCDCALIIGTSLNVYPAANLVSLIDPKKIINIGYDALSGALNLKGNASEIVPLLVG